MAEKQHIQHVRSSVSGKVPTADVLEYGEIAVNYADEVIYIKNTNNEVVGIGKSIEEAPVDGNQYVRQDGEWSEVIVPTVNNATLTIQKNGTSVGTFTANASSDNSINIETHIVFTDKTASSWVSDSTYADFAYRCDLACPGVLETDYAEVVFNVAEATSGVYSPVCHTSTDIVSIWASENTTITVPTIIITR